MNHYDVIVLGAGAAGLFCAATAGQRGRRVLLLEHNRSVGRKIAISGGGRCNFTNLFAEPKRYVSQNPRFCYSALARYTPKDFVALVERHGIAWHEKKLGQLFCDDSAQQIIDLLLHECAEAGVDLRTECKITGITHGDEFAVETSLGTFTAPALVVATGGLSIPKLGATPLAYRLAEQFGVPIIAPAPGLVPFTLAPAELDRLGDLSGIAFEARVRIGKTAFDEAVLITHRGLSGPAILQISSYWEAGNTITLDLFPGGRLEEELLREKYATPKRLPELFLRARLTTRLAERLCSHHDWTRTLGEMSDAALRGMARTLQEWEITPAGTEGYLKAEVTRGGIDTRALSPKSLEVRAVPGLYFIGEAVDVTGWLGGYNFQWAWASGHAAGSAV